MPGVLVEGLYLTNAEDAARLAEAATPELLARAYADGVAAFLGPPAERATVVGEQGAYLRPAPLLGTRPLALLPRGATVSLEERAPGDAVRGANAWWRVESRGRPGFVFARLLAPATPAPAAAGGTAVVRPDALPTRLRAAPTRASPIVARAWTGEVLDVLGAAAGESVDGRADRWLKVRRGGAVGWVWAPLVADIGSGATPPGAAAVVRDDGSGLPARLRRAPGRAAAIVARAPAGAALEVLEAGRGEAVDGGPDRWLRVRRGRTEGWVWAPLVTG
jgi:hypothetical protein